MEWDEGYRQIGGILAGAWADGEVQNARKGWDPTTLFRICGRNGLRPQND